MQGTLILFSVMTLRGWMEWEVGWRLRREEIYVYIWLTHVEGWQKSSQHCNSLPIKNKIKILKIV